MHEGPVGGKWLQIFESLILIFQVLHLFPVSAESFLSKSWYVTASNLRAGGM
jgi:hypothetical protein